MNQGGDTATWNFAVGDTLSGGSSQSREWALRERRGEDMIDQRTVGDRPRPSAALDEARLRQQAIGVRLRQMFDEVVNEQVPDEFLEILRRADQKKPENG